MKGFELCSEENLFIDVSQGMKNFYLEILSFLFCCFFFVPHNCIVYFFTKQAIKY